MRRKRKFLVVIFVLILIQFLHLTFLFFHAESISNSLDEFLCHFSSVFQHRIYLSLAISSRSYPLLQYDNKGNRHWPESAVHDCVFDADPQDVEIMERLRNVYSETRRASSDNCVKK